MIYLKNKIFAIKKYVFSKTRRLLTSKKNFLFQNHDRDELFDFAKVIQSIAMIFNNFLFFYSF